MTETRSFDKWSIAAARVSVCETYLQLRAEGYSLRQSARAVRMSPSFFSGQESWLQWYRQAGIYGVLSAQNTRPGRLMELLNHPGFQNETRYLWRVIGKEAGWQ